MRKIKAILLFLLMSTGSLYARETYHIIIGSPDKGENLIEKTKKVTYSYNLKADTPISIRNHYGDVKVKFWKSKSVKVDIQITANAPSEERVKSFLDIVEIKSNDEDGLISFETDLHCLDSDFKNNISKGENDEDKNFLRVDYLVYMPEGHNLTVNNSNGVVYIPEFTAVLNITQEYGDFYADHLSNNQSKIEVNFGKAFIKSMKGGELSSTQTKLVIDKAENLKMTNSCGKIQVLEANNINLKASYTKGYIGKINQSCKLNVNYSKEFTLGEIMDEVDQLEIESSHTNLRLPVCTNSQYYILADTKHTDLVMKDKPKVQMVSSVNNTPVNISEASSKQNSTKVILTSRYGKVEVK